MQRRRVFIIILLCAVLLVAIGVVALYELRQPPLVRLRQALGSLEEARKAQAQRLASGTYRLAQTSLIAGQQAMAEISGSWWPFATYHVADSLLSESIRLSKLAMMQSGKTQMSEENGIRSEVAELRDSLKVWRAVLDQSLPRAEEALLYRSASLTLQIAESMLHRNQYETVGEYADTVRSILGNLRRRYAQHNALSRKSLRQSSDWVAKTVEQSRQSGRTALIVDKSKHHLFVLSAGKAVDSMVCDLGFNSGYQKRMSGDGATPEGMYFVTKVHHNSKYYRAFLLNYPNAEDRRRFQSNLSAGAIPANAKIGGLIEIHGRGGTGRDWTDGCVAVADRDIDALLRIVSVGTPVTIVRAWEK